MLYPICLYSELTFHLDGAYCSLCSITCRSSSIAAAFLTHKYDIRPAFNPYMATFRGASGSQTLSLISARPPLWDLLEHDRGRSFSALNAPTRYTPRTLSYNHSVRISSV